MVTFWGGNFPQLPDPPLLPLFFLQLPGFPEFHHPSLRQQDQHRDSLSCHNLWYTEEATTEVSMPLSQHVSSGLGKWLVLWSLWWNITLWWVFWSHRICPFSTPTFSVFLFLPFHTPGQPRHFYFMSLGHGVIQSSKSHPSSEFVPSPNNFTRVLNPTPQESAPKSINSFLTHLIFQPLY